MTKAILLTATILVFSGIAQAKQAPHFSPLSSNEQFVAQIADFSRKNLHQAKLPNGKAVGRESKKEMKIPLLPFEKEQEVVDRGVFAVTAEWCGFDWQKSSFEPFMRSERSSGKWNDKQLAYMGVMHGFTMGMVDTKLRESGKCTKKHKDAVKKYIAQLK
jgi:hypothetical protein